MAPKAHNTEDTPSSFLRDLGRLRLSTDQAFYAELDRQTLQKEIEHRTALAAAAAEHERIRRSAEIARLRIEHELEKELQRRRDEEIRDLDRVRREKAELELVERRREIERARQDDVERRKAENEERALIERQNQARAVALADEERRKLKEKLDAEEATRRREREEEDRRARAATANERARQALQRQQSAQLEKTDHPPPPELPSVGTKPASTGSQSTEREAVHGRYTSLHQKLKQLRSNMTIQSKKNPALKSMMGDMRREIRKCVGQLTEGKGANRGPTAKLMTILKVALADTSSPRLDVREYIILTPTNKQALESSNNSPEVPSLLIYLLNIFAKATIAQFISEAGVSPKTADPIGIVAVQIFASNDFRWNGISLIDLLIAKYHVVCPVLFGIYGSEKSENGRKRLGWWREEKDGPWLSEQRHSERMTGLGAGFAAFALRNFEKSRLDNPYPNWNYWQALQGIISVPADEATLTHFVVLKAMVEGYEPRFIEFYGRAGLAALRKALIEFPNVAGQGSVAARAVAVLPDVLKKDKKLTL
ncbi:MAG: hypothetical protein M1817_006821 [Caeruleum heppii]|nr:MAG: hypothetical protein M1817_006821 [Caeruleum heppii]